jgi:hypothetical protein
MKKLLALLTLLLTLMGLLAVELLRSDPVAADADSVELAERPERPRAASEPGRRPPADMTELQRVIRQGSEP